MNNIFAYACAYHVLAKISKMPVKNRNFKISSGPDLATHTQLLQFLHLIAYCVEKGNLHLSHVIEYCLLRTYLVIIHKKSKLKILHRSFYLSKKEVFHETASL